ncbi:MAG: GH116 family glycosyl-hydrolase, partial [Phycisphaerae bacterium]|nr:GH116 family glycosyl-hydrolase [Phycisphaerae bacterium]
MTHLPWLTGKHLGEVAFPLGGIGTGTISLGGRGNLRDWEIFNSPGKGNDIPALFALWCKPAGGKPVARVLEGEPQPPFIDRATF